VKKRPDDERPICLSEGVTHDYDAYGGDVKRWSDPDGPTVKSGTPPLLSGTVRTFLP